MIHPHVSMLAERNMIRSRILGQAAAAARPGTLTTPAPPAAPLAPGWACRRCGDAWHGAPPDECTCPGGCATSAVHDQAPAAPGKRVSARPLRLVYLAARYSRRAELSGYRAVLAAHGITVTSRWLNGSHQLDNHGIPITDDGERRFENGDPAVDHLRVHFAAEDAADVMAADTLVAFTEPPRASASRGGRHVELGMALATGKHVVVIGPRENVFCWLPQVEHHDTWHQFATRTGLATPAPPPLAA